jgi:two-component system chemotaxis response regulator CheB
MAQRDILVIGASAGGVEALQELVGGLPAQLEASIFIVLHTAPSGPNLLAEVLQRRSALRVVNPTDGARIEKGRVYVGQRDHHLLIEGERIRIARGPKENRSRPSVDALFRSAAYACGPRVIGVILSGTLDDGTAGLWTVKRRGGTAVVQDPKDARYASMSESALRYVDVDHVVPIAQMAPLLVRLVKESPSATGEPVNKDLEIETAIARGGNALTQGVMTLGAVSPFTCPECHGVLLRLKDGGVPRFRCHTGHAFSVATLLSEVTTSIEDSFWIAIRAIDEAIMLFKHMAKHALEMGDAKSAQLFEHKAAEAQSRSDAIRAVTLQQEALG